MTRETTHVTTENPAPSTPPGPPQDRPSGPRPPQDRPSGPPRSGPRPPYQGGRPGGPPRRTSWKVLPSTASDLPLRRGPEDRLQGHRLSPTIPHRPGQSGVPPQDGHVRQVPEAARPRHQARALPRNAPLHEAPQGRQRPLLQLVRIRRAVPSQTRPESPAYTLKAGVRPTSVLSPTITSRPWIAVSANASGAGSSRTRPRSPTSSRIHETALSDF